VWRAAHNHNNRRLGKSSWSRTEWNRGIRDFRNRVLIWFP
jgi:hypothetical protein